MHFRADYKRNLVNILNLLIYSIDNIGYDIEILSKIVEQNFSSLFALHIMAVNPTDISNTQEKTKKEIRDLFVLTTISAERSLDEADNVKEKPLSTVMNRIFKIAVEDF